jgi:acyl-CoA reductase-like NAD-dependent aldehyde dehydrogenase
MTLLHDREIASHTPWPTPFGNVVDGLEQPSASGATFVGTDPTTGADWGVFAEGDAQDVDAAVRSGHMAFETVWATMAPIDRGRRLAAWGDLLARHADRIAALESVQNGKVVAELRAQVVACRDWLTYYGGLAGTIEGAVIPLSRSSVLNYTTREPLGVVAVILPWNSPTFHLVMAAAPALAAGNCVVVKPSEVTSASAVLVARLAVEAGLPPGVVSVVTGHRPAAEALVEHELVAGVSFIGSVGAGRAIGARAGHRLIPSTLELGGKSPHIVFADADLDLAEAGLVAGIFAAAGQTCIAGSRAYLQRSIHDELLDRVADRAERIRLGDPLDQATEMGPVATAAQLGKDQRAVEAALDAGGEVRTGGSRVDVPGLPGGTFFAPTILHRLGPDNPVLHEEIFGPVLAVCPFDDESEVLDLANATAFGLGAGVWTRDVRRAHRMARGLAAGTVWLNTYRALAPNSPFGGFKDSGIGRNNGAEAIDRYLQTKSVWCELGTEPLDPFVIRV